MRRVLGILLLALSASGHAADGFLEADEVAKLEPHPDIEGVSRYITPGEDPASYPKLIMGSVSFTFAEDSKVKSIDADEMKQISDALKSAFVAAASEHREVVLTKGPGAALVNLAITDIDMRNKKRGLLGYTPVGLVVTTAGNLSGARTQLRDAHIEGEIVDSVSGKVIGIFRVDDIAAGDHDKMSWDQLVSTFQQGLSQAMAAWE